MKKDNYIWFLIIALVVIAFFGVKKMLVGTNDKLPREFDALFIKYASKHGLDPKMMKAIAMKESSLGQNPRVKNKELSTDGKTYGLFQIKLSTAKHYVKDIELSDLIDSTEKAFDAVGFFLADLKRKFNNDEKKIVISYNQGETHTKKGNDFTGDYFPKYLNFKKMIG